MLLLYFGPTVKQWNGTFMYYDTADKSCYVAGDLDAQPKMGKFDYFVPANSCYIDVTDIPLKRIKRYVTKTYPKLLI